jgi:predicted component of type VI protein secretion system
MGPLVDLLCEQAASPLRGWLQTVNSRIHDHPQLLSACRAAIAFLPVRFSVVDRGTFRYLTRAPSFRIDDLLGRPIELTGISDVLHVGDLGSVREDESLSQGSSGRQRRVQDSIVRSLDALFNSEPLQGSDDLVDYPEIASSVLNFGFGITMGTSVSSLPPAELEDAVRAAIQRFETRIDSRSLDVRVMRDHHPGDFGKLTVMIDAALAPELGQQPVRVITELDLGSFRVKSRIL